MKIDYLGAILKRFKYFIYVFILYFCWHIVVISIYIYGVDFFLKIQWESGFLRGTPPLCNNGRSRYLMQLSVKKTLS